MKLNKTFALVAVLFCVILTKQPMVAAAQSIMTVGDFFKTVSEKYSKINDFEVTTEITVDKQAMNGKVSFKKPNMLRIDFSSPANQVIVFNGDDLTIYLPGSSAILQQHVEGGSAAGGASIATPQGLSLISRYYYMAYETGPNPVPLEEGSEEKVVRLVLNRKNSTESFTKILLSISPDTKLIRRVEAFTPQGQKFVFDFYDYSVNVGIAEQRFIYDAPSSANNYNNFLY